METIVLALEHQGTTRGNLASQWEVPNLIFKPLLAMGTGLFAGGEGRNDAVGVGGAGSKEGAGQTPHAGVPRSPKSCKTRRGEGLKIQVKKKRAPPPLFPRGGGSQSTPNQGTESREEGREPTRGGEYSADILAIPPAVGIWPRDCIYVPKTSARGGQEKGGP